MEIDLDFNNKLLPGLPAYAGGRMSNTVYDGGDGLNTGLRIGELLRCEISLSDDDFFYACSSLNCRGFRSQRKKLTRIVLKLRSPTDTQP